VAGTAIAGVGLFIGLVQQTYAIPLSARLRFGWISVLDLVKQGVLVAVIVACVVAGAGLLPFFLANVASAAVVLAATLVLVRASTETSLMPLAERATWARVMRELVPYALAAIAGLIYFRLGVILLGYVSSDEQVGLYSTAFRITEVLAAAPFIIVSAGFPILARAARDDDERLRYGLQRLFDASLLLGGAVVVPLVVGARFAISAIAPISEFGGSVVVLQLQAVAIVFTFLVATFSFALLSLKRFRTLLWCNIVALVTAAVLTPALGPVLGAKGAAIATTSAEAVLSVAYVVGLARVRPDLVPRIGILPRLLVAAAAGLAMALLGLPVFVEAALAGLVYVGLAYALRAVPPELVNALLRRDPGHSGH